MAYENTQATEGTNDQTAAAAQSGERTFTQEEVNRLVGEARTKVRKQYEGYVDGAQAAEAAERASKAEAELQELKAQAQRSADVSAAAQKAGIPLEVAQMLNGKDADELLEQAQKLLRLMPVHPTRTDDGGAQVTAKTSTAKQFADLLGQALG